MEQLTQLQRVLEDKQNILVVFDRHSECDAVASATVLAQFLTNRGNTVDIVSSGFEAPKRCSFMNGSDKITAKIDYLQKHVLSVDVSKSGVRELSYNTEGDMLHIYITPEHGTIEKRDVRSNATNYRYDVIFVVDTASLESLGDVYMEHSDFFVHTPIVNIDHKVENTHFGHINLVDITASTTSEIVFDLLKAWKPEAISKEVATSLLGGMIAKTNSFKQSQVRHKSLQVASELVQLGADRNFIIGKLYQTKSLSTFKLWGAALSQLQMKEDVGLVWTTLTREDFTRSGAREHDLQGIIDELIANTPQARIIMLLHEHPDPKDGHEIHGVIQTHPPHDPHKLSKRVNGTVSAQNISFVVTGEKNLKQVEKEVLAHIGEFVAL